jgi:aryl-alcohol dehydrogenase-like predicted oxidoreductase
MDYRTLGRTGVRVSVMGLGCGGHSRLGISQNLGEENAVAVVRRALEIGVNFIDTAEAYGTEPVVGKAITAVPRSEVVISTKVSTRQDGALRTAGQLRDAAEAGLRRLGVEAVDVLHLHGVSAADYDYCVSELMPAQQQLRDEGKIRFVGITEAFAPDPTHAMLTRAVEDDCWEVVMVGFNLINQSARERVFPVTQAKGIGTLDMFAVRRALQSVEALQAQVTELTQRRAAHWDIDTDVTEALAFLQHVASGAPNTPPIADSLPDVAYRFCRDEPGVDVVLSGTGNVAHLEANAASLTKPPLPEALTARLHRAFEGVDSVSGN